MVVDKAQVIRLAGQYTPCAGCSAAVKLLLQRPIADNRLLNAVMADDPEGNCLRCVAWHMCERSHYAFGQ